MVEINETEKPTEVTPEEIRKVFKWTRDTRTASLRLMFDR